jgi:CIC family chloride channel protein
MMGPSPRTFIADYSVRAFREAYPLGSANVVVAVDKDGRYRGLISVPEAHAIQVENGADGGPITDIAHLQATALHTDDNVGRALEVFGAPQA